MAVFPTFGEGAYVNTDYTPTVDPNDPDGLYYSDWGSWGWPMAIYYIEDANQFIAVWANQYFDGAVMGFDLQCRYVYPTSPVTMGDVVTLYNMEVTRTLNPGGYDGHCDMYTQQQVIFNATIGTDLYLHFVCDSDDNADNVFGTNWIDRGVLLRVNCSGPVPIKAAEKVEEFSGTHTGGFRFPDATLYNIANVNGKLLGYPHIASEAGSFFREWDTNLNEVWSQEEYFDRGEIPFLGDSDTNEFFAFTWEGTGRAWLCDYTGSGVNVQVAPISTAPYEGAVPSGLPDDYYEWVEVATIDLYPRKRGFGHNNAMIIANYGYAAHNVWREGTQMFAEPTVFINVDDPDFGTFGPYAFDDGPSYGFAIATVAGPEQYLTFVPTYSGFEVNVGWDQVAERQNMVDEIGGYWFIPSSFSPFCSAAQAPSGVGIILLRPDHAWNEFNTFYMDGGTEPAGKMKAIPFFLGQPDLAGELTEKERKFWRNRPY